MLLLGGPTGVGKTATLRHLQDRLPRSALLDADDVWRVAAELAVEENRSAAIANVVEVMRGYFRAGCDLGILCWVFARPQLYEPVVAGLRDHVDRVSQLYLTADPETLRARLNARGEAEKLDYALGRLALIDDLPYPKIDTTDLAPQEVAERVVQHIDDL